MIVGYARTSTATQEAGLEAQRRDLKAAGCERIFEEQVSSVDRDKRTQLADALEFIREGDVLVATKMDRLARSVPHMIEIAEKVAAKGAGLRILANGDMDTTTPVGQLMFNMLGAIAQFERALMLERQREGIAKAKAAGKYRGRAPTAQRKADEVHRLKDEGIGATEIAQRVGIGRASVYRILGGKQ